MRHMNVHEAYLYMLELIEEGVEFPIAHEKAMLTYGDVTCVYIMSYVKVKKLRSNQPLTFQASVRSP